MLRPRRSTTSDYSNSQIHEVQSKKTVPNREYGNPYCHVPYKYENCYMLQQQEEIRGLQTENRRILDILLNQQNQEEDSTDQ